MLLPPPEGRRPRLLPAVWAAALILGACTAQSPRSRNVPDIPVYPGAQLTEQSNEPDRDPIDTYNVPDVLEATVLAWYREQMVKNGWRATTDPSENVVIYQNKKGCMGFVMATQDPGGRDVMLQLSEQRVGSVCIPYTPMPTGNE